ncbi:MAG: SPOR domain-containing protein [Gammaproteobacteria bacterium]
MARDYKHSSARAQRGKKTQPRQGSWVSFLSGLGVGLVVAFGVYLWSAELPPPAALVDGLGERFVDDASFAAADTPAPALPKPKFDFYKILPEMEVPIPDWELGESSGPADPEPGLAPGTYLLQVGSFKRFEDADRAKASLALRGIEASIQRVVINGQDVWFRVHVGPLSDAEDIRRMRVRLIENDMDFILLRIGTAEQRG